MKTHDDGFTILEVLVAVTIFAIGVLAVASMQGSAIHANSIANVNTVATGVAQQVMDDLLSVPITKTPPNTWYTQFVSSGITTSYNYFPPYNGISNTTLNPNYVIAGVGTFTAQYTVTYPYSDPVLGPIPHVSQIEVRVSRDGVEIPFSLIGYRWITP